MNTDIQMFQFGISQIRTIIKQNEPWFVGKDICEYFGDTNYRRSLARLDEDERGVSPIDTPGGKQSMTIISELGLYSLLFLMQPQQANMPAEQCDKRIKQIKQFKRWVTHEVLPSIRKHGAYMTPETIEKALINPDFIIGLATKLKEHQAELAAKNSYIETLEPKAEFFDSVADAKNAIEIGEAAKVLNMGIGRNKLFQFLREQRVLINNNQPYQVYIDKGYFRVIEQKYTKPDGSIHINIKTLVYQKGLAYIRKLLNKR